MNLIVYSIGITLSISWKKNFCFQNIQDIIVDQAELSSWSFDYKYILEKNDHELGDSEYISEN